MQPSPLPNHRTFSSLQRETPSPGAVTPAPQHPAAGSPLPVWGSACSGRVTEMKPHALRPRVWLPRSRSGPATLRAWPGRRPPLVVGGFHVSSPVRGAAANVCVRAFAWTFSAVSSWCPGVGLLRREIVRHCEHAAREGSDPRAAGTAPCPRLQTAIAVGAAPRHTFPAPRF